MTGVPLEEHACQTRPKAPQNHSPRDVHTLTKFWCYRLSVAEDFLPWSHCLSNTFFRHPKSALLKQEETTVYPRLLPKLQRSPFKHYPVASYWKHSHSLFHAEIPPFLTPDKIHLSRFLLSGLRTCASWSSDCHVSSVTFLKMLLFEVSSSWEVMIRDDPSQSTSKITEHKPSIDTWRHEVVHWFPHLHFCDAQHYDGKTIWTKTHQHCKSNVSKNSSKYRYKIWCQGIAVMHSFQLQDM